jgi:hypothetical protein
MNAGNMLCVHLTSTLDQGGVSFCYEADRRGDLQVAVADCS